MKPMEIKHSTVIIKCCYTDDIDGEIKSNVSNKCCPWGILWQKLKKRRQTKSCDEIKTSISLSKEEIQSLPLSEEK